MRIIAGEAKGRTLFSPKGADTRPTAEKIRGAIFNILYASVVDTDVLDLFGGTGAMALEALSRGAARAVIVDASTQAMQVIRRNASSVLPDGFDGRLTLYQTDYQNALAKCVGRRFDIVFLDPPYRMTEYYTKSLLLLKQYDLLSDEAVIVLERESDESIALPEGYSIESTRNYGSTAIDFIREV